MNKKIAIVGAGVGGLATAARLAKQGFSVEVFEKLSRCGGRANIIEDRGFKFDTGPSFVMMPSFFKEVFDYCQEDIKDYLELKVLDVNYKIVYGDGQSLMVYRDNQKTERELERIEPGASKAYREFVRETGAIYQAVVPILYQSFTPKDLFNPRLWPLVPKLKISKSYWQLARKFFKTDKLCYAFTFEAMFIGVSPFKTPAFYSVISYTDQVDKISHAMGGMYQIPLALERMAKKFGAKFHYNSEISSIEKSGQGVDLKIGSDKLFADKAVINADYSYSIDKLLKRRLPDYDYSCSVHLLYWGMKKKIPNLEHHNLFFARDLPQNLKNIFEGKGFSDDFSFYVHVPTVTDTSLAPEGKDILYLLIPVPNLKVFQGRFKPYEQRIREVVLAKLKAYCGLDLEELIEVEHKFYPEDFISRYNVQYGATFGLAHTLGQSAFFRPANQDSRMKNIYFVGASTQPGGGLPPVIASSRIVSDLISG
ncbi:MAG: phytoene desaturase family protein [Candidatus Omnitrophota bacterium]